MAKDIVADEQDSNGDIKVIVGRIASGDKLINAPRVRASLHEQSNASACDMGGASAAFVCHHANVPVIGTRRIGDNANCVGTEDYDAFGGMMARRCAKIARGIARTINESNPTSVRDVVTMG